MKVKVRVKTNAKKQRIVWGDALTVYVKSPPVEGRANAEMLSFLKRVFGEAKLVSGHKYKTKVVEIPQKTREEAKNVFIAYITS